MAWAEDYLRTKWHLDPSSRLATTDMGRKLKAVPLFRGAGSPSNNVAWAEAYLRNKWYLIHPAVWAQDMGRKLGALSHFWGGRAGSPSNTMLLGSRPTFLSSGILIHRAVWPQQTGSKNWGLCAPFLVWRKLGPHLSQCGRPRPTSIPSFILIHPSNRLAAIHQRHRQTGEDSTGQTTADSIWRTVLQTVAEKRNP